MKTAITTCISGQDGAYLAKLLFNKSYKVVGLVKNSSDEFFGLKYLEIIDAAEIIECDLLNIKQISTIINNYLPDIIYNLAAQSSVFQFYKNPISTFEFNTISVFNIENLLEEKNKTISRK